MADKAWDEEHSCEKTIEVIADLATCHIDRILDPTLRESLTAAVHEKDWCGLVTWDLRYDGSASIADLIHARQALGFFQKNSALDIGVDKESVARKTFQASEVRCRETNDLFTQWSMGNLNFPRGVDGILHAAQRKIAKVLGRVPALSELDLTFGPGATTSVPRRNACARMKLSARPSCSANFLSVLPAFLEELPAWSDNLVENFHVESAGEQHEHLVERYTVEVHNGVLAFVPKNAKTYRTVMIEPTLNTMLQGGYGRWIAKRLRRVGQDITDQDRNKVLARQSSLTGALATLDLSSASDTISVKLVEHLLPVEWVLALSSCRTPSCEDGSETIFLQKYSSMGNGFTFPLQTLIFWALVSACAGSEADVSVYGDDILCPVEHVPAVLQVFDVCGFLINKEKSYWSGPFRESCGGDYYLGISIRPFYLKTALSYEKLFLLHNYYVRQYDAEMAAHVLRLIPLHLRLWGPDGYGDGHLIGDWSRKPHKREDGWGGWLFSTFTKIGNAHTRVLPGDRVLPAYSIYVSSEPCDSGGELLLEREPTFASVLQSITDFARRFRPAPLPKRVHRRSGVVHDPLPGVRGYKQTQIYTFTCA